MALSYFFYFLVFGTTMPYLSPVLLDMGYSRQQIGGIWSVIYAFSMVVPMLGGRLSDRFASADRTLRLCAGGMTTLAILMWFQPREPSLWFLLILFAYAAMRAPVISMQDTLGMQAADNDPKRFSRMRMVGSMAFAIAVTGFGYLADAFGKLVYFPTLVVLCSMFFLNSWFIPKERKAPPSPGLLAFWRSLSRRWWLWLLAMMCHWFCFGPYNYGFTLLLEEQGVPIKLAGWFWMIGVAAEIAVFFSSGWFFRRFSHRTLLFAAFAANLIRWLLLGLFPHPYVIAASQLLHGIGFATFYAAAMQGIHYYCGGKDRASFQGLFSSCVGGVAGIIGTFIAGQLHELMPLRTVILWLSPVEVVGMILLWRFPLRESRGS